MSEVQGLLGPGGGAVSYERGTPVPAPRRARQSPELTARLCRPRLPIRFRLLRFRVGWCYPLGGDKSSELSANYRPPGDKPATDTSMYLSLSLSLGACTCPCPCRCCCPCFRTSSIRKSSANTQRAPDLPDADSLGAGLASAGRVILHNTFDNTFRVLPRCAGLDTLGLRVEG